MKSQICVFGRICLNKVLLLSLVSGSALAEPKDEIAELKARLQQLENKLDSQSKTLNQKTDTIAGELEQTKLNQVIPQKAELKSSYGLGPAASSVYAAKQGVSIGGYAEGNYRNFISDEGSKKDQGDFLRLVGYLGYRFNDWILFNSEIELEHGTTGGIGGDAGDEEGEVSVEFAYLDFLHNPAFNTRVGMVLIPMGFINEMHEPNTFHGVRRPEVENVIIPSTWRELGAGAFGELELAGKLEYRTYLVNGLRASRFSDGGIRDSRQKGNRAVFEDVAWTGRLDYSPDAVTGLTLGGSFWIGNSGQDEVFAEQTPNVQTSLAEAHAQYRILQLELRALAAWGYIDDSELLSTELEKTIAERVEGWYAEAAYDVLPHFVSGTTQYLAPFVRYESYDTQASVPSGFARNASLEKQVVTAGISYRPISDVVLKLDYRNFNTDGEKPTADEIALGIGLAF